MTILSFGKFYCSFDNIDFLQKEVKIISSIVDIYKKKKKSDRRRNEEVKFFQRINKRIFFLKKECDQKIIKS